MIETKNSFEPVKKIFSEHLEVHGYRKTPERFAVLEEIYSRHDHFDAEALYIAIKKKLSISRATVYNTLELLVTCELVKKHQFGNNNAQYEKSYGYRQHDHLICTECKKVIEFCDPRIHQINNMIGELMHFTVTGHSLMIFGKCQECSEKATKS
jgi:Fur family ferric uptake transcriptional regulator